MYIRHYQNQVLQEEEIITKIFILSIENLRGLKDLEGLKRSLLLQYFFCIFLPFHTFGPVGS
jgi:hypothetical protein